MKKIYLVLAIGLFSYFSFSQVVAYPSTNYSKVWGASCFDLYEVTPLVIGHQINVGVTYYETLSNAQNELNVLDRFYEPLSNPQTIYARVDSLINSQFAIETCVLEAAPSGGIPAGISPCTFDVCDVDNNGSELVNLNNLRCIYNGYAFPTTTFCGSDNSDVVTNYYNTENDAINETNEILVVCS